jgi:hypothetical protein
LTGEYNHYNFISALKKMGDIPQPSQPSDFDFSQNFPTLDRGENDGRPVEINLGTTLSKAADIGLQIQSGKPNIPGQRREMPGPLAGSKYDPDTQAEAQNTWRGYPKIF